MPADLDWTDSWREQDIKQMVGVTMRAVDRVGDDVLRFTAEDGRVFEFYYSPDCCASCHIEDINGDLEDLIGTPITLAEETHSRDVPPSVKDEYVDSYTWTFYHYGTDKGRVVVRWYGTSNGYYSERASMRIGTPTKEETK